MNALARGDATSDPILTRILIAQRVNRQHGGAVIAAWEVDSLPPEWMEAFTGLEELPRRIAERKAVDAEFVKFRAEHKQRTERRH